MGDVSYLAFVEEQYAALEQAAEEQTARTGDYAALEHFHGYPEPIFPPDYGILPDGSDAFDPWVLGFTDEHGVARY